MINKKSQSQVIATILLVLIVMGAVAIIIQIVIPFIYDQLEGGECLDLIGKFEIKNNPQYTCYDETDNPATDETERKLYVQIHTGEIETNLSEGFQWIIEIEGNSESYKITEENPDGLYMSDESSDLILPKKNTEKTYYIDLNEKGITGRPEAMSIYPILNDLKCDEVYDRIETVVSCFDPIS